MSDDHRMVRCGRARITPPSDLDFTSPDTYPLLPRGYLLITAKRTGFSRLWSTLWAPIVRLKDYPVICRTRSIHLVGFGLFAAAGCLAFGVVLLSFLYGKQVSDRNICQIGVLFPLLIVFIWLGARAMNFAHFGTDFIRNPAKHLKSTGFNVHGGFVGALAWGAIVGACLHVSFLVIMDAMCLSALISQFMGRIGCYNYGCCYGTPTSLPCAVSYHNKDAKILRVNPGMKGVPVHPVQLYMAFASLTLFVAFLMIGPLTIPTGYIFAVFMTYHGIGRLLFEKCRGDLHRDYDPTASRLRFTGGFSILLTVAGLSLLVYLVSRRPVQSIPPRPIGGLLQDHALFLGMVVVAAVLTFIGYGVHGPRLGTFPFTRHRSEENPQPDP